MNKKWIFLIIMVGFLIIPALAFTQSNLLLNIVKNIQQSKEQCSLEIEGLKLCTDTSLITVDSGNQVRIKLYWVNSTDADRSILRASSYKVTILNEKDEKLIPVLQRKIQNGNLTDEDNEKLFKKARGRYRSLYVEANKIERDEVWLTEKYDYDLTKEGNYYVTLEKDIFSAEGNTEIKFVLNNIKVQVK